MNQDWKDLNSLADLEQANEKSFDSPVVLFKHSTRCSISSMALNRLQRSELNQNYKDHLYYLDLIAHRDVSNAIAEKYAVYHESPQVLIIRNGECVYDASHSEIAADEIIPALMN